MEKPDWDFWIQLGRVEAWQAVALSLAIDPDLVRLDEDSYSIFHASNPEIANSFNKRTRLLAARIFFDFKTYGSVVGAGNLRLQISLGHFAGWAKKRDWSLPQELTAVAEQHMTLTEMALSGWEAGLEDKPITDENASSMVDPQTNSPPDFVPKENTLIPTASRKMPRGGDMLTRVIWTICYEISEENKEIIPKVVMSRLKQMANSSEKYHPLIGDISGGVKFEDGSGDEKELNSDALRKRIDGWRKVQTGTKQENSR